MNFFASRGGRKPKRKLAALALLGLVAGACVYDSDDRCGPHQVLYNDQRCVCEPGAALTPTGCVLCVENEVPGTSGAGCECAPGFSRPAAGMACEAVPAGLGTACSTAAPIVPCSDPVYSHCEADASGAGYCTSTGCTSPADCTGGYACNTSGATSFCQRPPVGLGKACTTPDDCAGTEATFCDTFQTHSCQVQGCSLAPNNCFSGFECCDLSAFGLPQPLCIPQGACAQ